MTTFFTTVPAETFKKMCEAIDGFSIVLSEDPCEEEKAACLVHKLDLVVSALEKGGIHTPRITFFDQVLHKDDPIRILLEKYKTIYAEFDATVTKDMLFDIIRSRSN